MSPTMNALCEAALALPRDERATLAAILTDSLQEDDGGKTATPWDDEIKRRMEAARRGEGHWLTEEEVNQRLEAKHGPLHD